MTCTHGENESFVQSVRFPSVDFPPLPDLAGAACVGHPILSPESWDLLLEFETHTERRLRRQQAAEVCAECPVRLACLQTALAEPAPSGVWGGWLFNPRTGGVTNITVGVQAAVPGGSGSLEPSVHEGSYAA